MQAAEAKEVDETPIRPSTVTLDMTDQPTLK